jgi:hypothetical protein
METNADNSSSNAAVNGPAAEVLDAPFTGVLQQPNGRTPAVTKSAAPSSSTAEPTSTGRPRLLDAPFNGALQPVDVGALDALDGLSLDEPSEAAAQPREPRMSRRRFTGLILLVLGCLAAVALGVRIELNKTKVQETALDTPSSRITNQQVAFGSLNQQLGTASAASSDSSVTVNGSLVLAPTFQPSNPIAGQLYYSQTGNQMQYYNGTTFVSLQGGGNTNVTNNNTFLTSVSNTTIGGGGLTGTGTPGTLAMFGSVDTLADSLISQSNGNLDVATSNTSNTSGDITIQSGNSSATGSGNVSIDVGTNVINGTVIEDKTFEDGLDNMVAAVSSSIAQSNVEAHSGSYSLAVTLESQIWDIGDAEPYTVPVTPGHTYYLSAWIRAQSSSATINCDAAFSTDGLGSYVGGNNLGVNVWSTVSDTSSGWTQVTGVLTAPLHAKYIALGFDGSWQTAQGVHYIDDISVTDMSSVSGSAVDIGTNNAQSITIGNSDQVGNTTITAGGAGVNIATTTGAINIATDSEAAVSAGSIELSAGGGPNGGGIDIVPQSNSTNAFQVQDASGQTTLLNVDTENDAISLGVGAGPSAGYTTVGASTGGSAANTMSAQKITTPADPANPTAPQGVVSVSAYIGADGIEASPHDEYQFAIYADNGSGAPGAYVVSTPVGTLGTSAGWYTLPLSTGLIPNTTYWLVYWQNGISGTKNGLSLASSSPGTTLESAGYPWASGGDNGLPGTFPAGGTSSNEAASIYVTYPGTSSAVSLNQFGTLSQTGAALFQDPTDSTIAFQIQNGNGQNLFTADTADMTILVSGPMTVSGSITVDGHIVTGGATPSIAAGAAACTSPTVSLSGDDTTGLITVTTGTGCTSAGILATLTFANTFGAAPHVTLTPATAPAVAQGYVDAATLSGTSFNLDAATAPLSSTTYKWEYQVMQ